MSTLQNTINNTLKTTSITSYTEVLTSANSSTAYTFDCSVGRNWLITLTGNCTFSISNVPASGVTSINIDLVQGSGPYTVTWPASFIWSGGTAPTLTTTNGHVDSFVARTTNTGTNFRAYTASLNFSA